MSGADPSYLDRSREMLAQSGQSTLNALLVMNGGATAAFLTFLTPLIEKSSVDGKFVAALEWFIYGLIAVVIAFATIHLCILFVRYNKNGAANVFYALTVIAGLISGGSFILGVNQAKDAVVKADANTQVDAAKT